MGVQKRTRKFAQTKRVIGKRDSRLYDPQISPPNQLLTTQLTPPTTSKENQLKADAEATKKKTKNNEVVREIPQVSSALFFQHNTALIPPYSVLVDTNFLSHTVQHKLEMLSTMMDCLYAKCIPIITDCMSYLLLALALETSFPQLTF